MKKILLKLLAVTLLATYAVAEMVPANNIVEASRFYCFQTKVIEQNTGKVLKVFSEIEQMGNPRTFTVTDNGKTVGKLGFKYTGTNDNGYMVYELEKEKNIWITIGKSDNDTYLVYVAQKNKSTIISRCLAQKEKD